MASWPLVGREADVAILAEALRRGRGIVLTGDAGVGKSRLGRAVLERLAADGWATAAFEAGPAAGAVPFLPFASLLRSAAHEHLERVVEATDTLVARGARVAVLVDDAHALDPVSLAFVSHLIATTDVHLLLTVRSADADPHVVRAWTDALQRVELSQLDRRAVDHLMLAALGDVAPSAVRWVWDTAAGNPLYVRELVTDAVERGVLVERDGRWTLAAGARPPGRRLQEIVAGRFGSLSDSERDAVELLAVAAPIGLRTLEALAGADAVQALERRGLVTADRSGHRVEVRLAHPIHGEVVRELLGPSTAAAHRRRLLDAVRAEGEHRRPDRLRAALWRVELGDTTDPASLVAAAEELVALTDGVLGDVDASGDARMSTGPQLLDRAAQLARAALDGGGGLDAAWVLILVLSRLGRHDEAGAVRASLGDLVADEADRVLVARLLADVDALILGDAYTAIARLSELESIVTSPGLLRSLRSTRAAALVMAGELRDALALSREVLDDAEATPEERIRVSAAAAIALASGGRTSEALDLLDRAAVLAAEVDVGTAVVIVAPRLVTLGYAGQLDELEALATASHVLSDQYGFDDGMAIFATTLASAAILRGRPRSALTWTDEALRYLANTDPLGVRRLTLSARAHASALMVDREAAAAAVAELDALGPANVFRDDETRARAWAHVADGHPDRAVEALIAGAEVAVENGRIVGAIGQLHDVARLGRAGDVSARVAELAADVDGAIVPAQAAHVLALAAGDADALEGVASAFVDVGALLYAAEAFAQAAALHRRAGARTRSSEAAARSRELVASCEGASTPALAGAEPLASLTKREREVVELASGGRSDREIAEQLVVSVRTVETHLHNAYAKLGVDGRDELSAAIARY